MAAEPIVLLDKAIADLEARLGLQPGQSINTNKNGKKKQNNKKNAKKQQVKPAAPPADQPDICKVRVYIFYWTLQFSRSHFGSKQIKIQTMKLEFKVRVFVFNFFVSAI